MRWVVRDQYRWWRQRHPIENNFWHKPIGFLSKASDKTTHCCCDRSFFPDRRNEWTKKAKEIARLLRHSTWHIAKMRGQDIGNAGETMHSIGHCSRRHGKVYMEDIGLPAFDFLERSRDSSQHPSTHFRNATGIFFSAKCFQTAHLHALFQRLFWQMRHSSSQHTHLMAAFYKPRPDLCGKPSSTAADGRMLIVENQYPHRALACDFLQLSSTS